MMDKSKHRYIRRVEALIDGLLIQTYISLDQHISNKKVFQKENSSSSTSSSLMTSPLRHHDRSSSGMSVRRPQNTKAAAQRLARVMATQSADEEEEEDDLLCDFSSAGIGLAGGRQTRNRSPLPVRNSVELPQSLRPTSVTRISTAVSSVEQPLSARSGSLLRPVKPKPTVELYPSPNALLSGRSSQPDESQSPSAQSNASGRSPSYMSSVEQPSSARFTSVGRPNLRVKTVSMAPSSVPPSLKPVASGIPPDPQSNRHKDKRLSLDFGTFKYKDAGGQQSSALQDELDMLQEENDSLLEKLRIAEERFEEADTRARQMEKQIASLGEGVSLEARLLSRKEADLQKREVALKVAAETYGGSNEETAALRMEIENAREEATSALDQLHEVEKEVKSLRTITQRMILTRDEMEEVVLKRCWLAQCWSLCVRYGIHAEIAGARHEYWSYYASRPVEVILAAGRKAKDENTPINNDLEERESVLQVKDEIMKKVNLESMLLVEKGLTELSSLKVEEAIAISMAQKRRPNILKSNDEVKLPTESENLSEAFVLSPDETEDVLLKQAWLMYFWRRAKNQGLEPDIAEERLQYWINHGDSAPTSHEAVDVQRGLLELRKLGIENKLWEESRRLIDPDHSQRTLLETEYEILS